MIVLAIIIILSLLLVFNNNYNHRKLNLSILFFIVVTKFLGINITGTLFGLVFTLALFPILNSKIKLNYYAPKRISILYSFLYFSFSLLLSFSFSFIIEKLSAYKNIQLDIENYGPVLVLVSLIFFYVLFKRIKHYEL